MSIILSILRLLLAFAVLVLAGGVEAGEAPRVPVAIMLSEGGRSILHADVPVLWGKRAVVEDAGAGGFVIDMVATPTRRAGGPAVDVWMRMRRGSGTQQMTVLVPRLTIGCSGGAAATIDRADAAAGPLHLTLAIDPAAIDPSCGKR